VAETHRYVIDFWPPWCIIEDFLRNILGWIRSSWYAEHSHLPTSFITYQKSCAVRIKDLV